MKGREWLSGALPLSYHGTLLRVITKPNQPRTNKKIQTKKKEPELSVFMGSALLRRFPPPPLPGPALRKSPAGNPPQASQTTEDHPFKIIVGTGRCIKPRTPCALISDLRVPVLLRVNGVAYLLSPLPHPVPPRRTSPVIRNASHGRSQPDCCNVPKTKVLFWRFGSPFGTKRRSKFECSLRPDKIF